MKPRLVDIEIEINELAQQQLAGREVTAEELEALGQKLKAVRAQIFAHFQQTVEKLERAHDTSMRNVISALKKA